MSQTLILKLSDGLYTGLQREANAVGTTPENLAATVLERQFGPASSPPSSDVEKQTARERFERHFGEVDLGHPTDADNESIDRDLAREYADTHEAG